MRKIILLLLCFIAMETIYANDSTLVLQYLVRQPKVKTAHPPLLLLLHGVGSNESDLFSFADRLPDEYLVISARAPISQGAGRNAWYQVDFSSGKPVYNFEQEENSRNLLIQFIGQLKDKYHVDAGRVYLCGFSQGAIMSYSVALTRPDLVKGIAVMSGRLLEEIKPKIAAKQATALRVYISHGANDAVLNVQYARDANAYLKGLGLHPTFKEYQAGHELNAVMLGDLVAWLKA